MPQASVIRSEPARAGMTPRGKLPATELEQRFLGGFSVRPAPFGALGSREKRNAAVNAACVFAIARGDLVTSNAAAGRSGKETLPAWRPNPETRPGPTR